MAETTYFIRMRGRVTGPFSLVEIRRMYHLGTLSRIHEMSADKANWRPAGSFPELVDSDQALVSAAASDDELIPLTEEDAVPPARTADAPEPASEIGFERRLGKLSLTEGMCAAVVLLFCANVPHTRIGGSLLWWWNAEGGVVHMIAGLYAVLAALVLMGAAIWLRGSGRGGVYAATAGAGLLLLMGAAAAEAGATGPLAFSVLPLALLGWVLCSVSLARARPHIEGARTMEMLAGGALAVTAPGALAWSIVGLVMACGNGPMPPWAIFAMVFSVLGWLPMLACGILALLGAAAGGKFKALAILSVAAPVLLAGAAGIAGYGLAGGGGEGATRFHLVQVLRLLVTTYTLTAVLAIGLAEVLARHWAPKPPAEDIPTATEVVTA